MTTSFDQTYAVTLTPTQFAAALRSPQFAVTRLHAAGRQDPELISHSAAGTQVRIKARYFARVEEMPGWMATRFTDHGPENHRTEEWTVTDTGLRADVVIESLSNGGTVTAAYAITPTATGSAWRVHGSSTVKIPLLGRKIEAYIVDSLVKAYASEAEEISAAGVLPAGSSATGVRIGA